ncbi:MAG: aminotransferase class V-fold PLP-dependent enzyme [Planctomycetota bacterium]|nr:MAG: aminotransferase class V-fold PLP-dependent enzyme [Planctomycetota bacterium]
MGIYEELGLEPIINASGAVTRLGGAPLYPAALDAFGQAAGQTVPLEQLHAVACRQIAEATGTEAGLVTSGAAAALTLGTAAILAGHDLARIERLPDCSGMPCEFVVAREHRNGYDHAVRAAGARFVEVGFHELAAGSGVRRAEAWEYEAAFGPHTAGVLYVLSKGACPPLKDVVERAHAHYLPVLVDAAGELPPRANLKTIAATGADLVAFSGGKAIRGPQATGILCGRRELISSAAIQMLDMDDHLELWQPPAELIDREQLPGMPRHGIGRGFKVAKEQIVALLVALRAFASGEYDALVEGYRARLDEICAALADVPARCHVQASDGESLPILEILVDERALGRTAIEVCRALRAGLPPCYVGHAALAEGTLVINPLHLDERNTPELARRLREELTTKS